MALSTFHVPDFHVPQHNQHPILSHWRSQIAQIWASTLRWLAGDAELKIWQTCDRAGHSCWHVYDPMTGESQHFGDEADVRYWLESRYAR